MTDPTHPASTDSPAEGGAVAWARRWYIDGETPKKERKANGRMAWPKKFTFHEVTRSKVFPDDAALYTRPAPIEPGVREKVEYLRKSRDGHAANAHAEFEKRVMATDALIAAREVLHQHYVDWDGEPEDALPLQEARAECDRVLDALLSSNTGEG